MIQKERTMKRLISFLDAITNSTIAHETTFDLKNQRITYKGRAFATFEWLGDTNIPIFNFSDEKSVFKRQQEKSMERLIKRFGFKKFNDEDEIMLTMPSLAENMILKAKSKNITYP